MKIQSELQEKIASRERQLQELNQQLQGKEAQLQLHQVEKREIQIQHQREKSELQQKIASRERQLQELNQQLEQVTEDAEQTNRERWNI